MEAGRDRQESTSPIETRREAMAPCPEEPGSKLAAVEKPLEPCPKRASLQETVLAVLEAAGTERGGARGDAEDQAQGRELVGMRSGGAEVARPAVVLCARAMAGIDSRVPLPDHHCGRAAGEGGTAGMEVRVRPWEENDESGVRVRPWKED
eukprot:92948-Rhodomonas_salina.1